MSRSHAPQTAARIAAHCRCGRTATCSLHGRPFCTTCLHFVLATLTYPPVPR